MSITKDTIFDVIKNGNVNALEILLNPDISAKKDNGNTLLHMASISDNKKMVALLIEKNIDVNAKNKDGETPLHLAVRNNCIDVVAFLIEKNADINARTNGGWTSLHYASNVHKSSNEHREKIVALLLKKNAGYEVVNAKTNDGWTPLHLASRNGHREIVEILIKNNADVNIIRDDGWTPFQLASKNGHHEIVVLLEGYRNAILIKKVAELEERLSKIGAIVEPN